MPYSEKTIRSNGRVNDIVTIISYKRTMGFFPFNQTAGYPPFIVFVHLNCMHLNDHSVEDRHRCRCAMVIKSIEGYSDDPGLRSN